MDPVEPPSGDLVAAFDRGAGPEDQLALLQSRYAVETVRACEHIEDDAVYYVIGGRTSYLIRTESPAIADGRLHFRSWVGDAPMRPLDLDRLKAAIDRQLIHRVRPKTSEKPDMSERDQILDVGGFSQLVDAAQRTGLVPGIATIIQVRDCEFRLGKHLQALQLMESQWQAFSIKAAQRTQQIAREDQEIASGRIKMSPRELQAKRQRDRQQTQAIDRARNRFLRVVEGLRTIVQRGM